MQSQYSAFPPISELLDILGDTSPSAPHALGKFEYHEAADYTDMACWTMLLAIAVTDIASYMEIEESIFETLHRRLKRIHDRIREFYLTLQD